MEHQLRHEEQERGDHVGHVLGHLVVAGIQGVHQFAGGAVTGHEVVGAHGVALQTDTEELGFQAGFHAGKVFLQNLVQAFGKKLTVTLALHGLVFGAVVYPDVHDARVILGLAHGIGNPAAALGVLDPEFADGRVRVGQGEVSALGMAEGSGVEIQLHIVFPRPLDPALEMLHVHLVAVYILALEVAVNLVEVQAMVTGDKALGKEDILLQFFHIARAAGIVAGGLDTAGKAGLAFKAHNVVGLPAVQGNGSLFQRRDGFVGVNADGGIALFGNLIRFKDVCFFHVVSVFCVFIWRDKRFSRQRPSQSSCACPSGLLPDRRPWPGSSHCRWP